MASALPETYKAAVFETAGAPLTIKQLPLRMPKAGEVLAKVIAVGVCHSDSTTQAGIMGNAFPRVPGHETVGDVVAVGDGVTNFKIGDRVGGAWHGGHDFTCKPCRRGLYQMCVNEAINGLTIDGGYAEYVILRAEAAVPIPKEFDPAAIAPLLCAGVTVFNSMRKMKVEQGSVVAIQGLGGLGHLALQFANKMGYEVVALSSSASKKDFATKLGANHYVDGSKEDAAKYLKNLGGAGMIVVTAPNPEIVGPLIGGLEAGGKLLMLAPVGDVPFNTYLGVNQGLSIHSWPSGHALDSQATIQFAQVHDVNCMIEKFPLDDAQKAFEYMMAGKARFRAVLTM